MTCTATVSIIRLLKKSTVCCEVCLHTNATDHLHTFPTDLNVDVCVSVYICVCTYVAVCVFVSCLF